MDREREREREREKDIEKLKTGRMWKRWDFLSLFWQEPFAPFKGKNDLVLIMFLSTKKLGHLMTEINSIFL